jgi:hypothetical protein
VPKKQCRRIVAASFSSCPQGKGFGVRPPDALEASERLEPSVP